MPTSDDSPSLGHLVNPDADELRTHSQTLPYLLNEPKVRVSPEKLIDFFRHVFSQDITADQVNLDLSDLKYNHSKPREAEELLEVKLNDCINPLSPNQFFAWPLRDSPPGTDRDRRLDLAIVPRKIPLSIAGMPHDSPPTPCNLPDHYAILACVEHTVRIGRAGYKHNRNHAYAKLNELLKCPLNLCSIVLGVHNQDMTIWYGDRSGVVEADIGGNRAHILAALVGFAKLPFKRDPCVDLHRLRPTRAYKITLAQGTYYGLYGQKDSVLYAADGINSRGTLVLAGIRECPLVETNHIAAFDAATAEDRVVIKFSYPSIPWDIRFSFDPSTHPTDWTLEWQTLQILMNYRIPNTPRLVAHDEHSITTRQVREAAGLTGERYRVRTILVTQPVADSTLRKETRMGVHIGLPKLVRVLKDVVTAHEAAWNTAKIAHCDISPGNIQIHQERGILADWEFAVSVDELHTAKAINSGTVLTMPPRLAYFRLMNIAAPNISRTPWDEMCSIFLCFIYAVLDERRHPNAPTLDGETTLGHISLRMAGLLDHTEVYCERNLRSQYSQNGVLVSRIKQAIALLFSHGKWTRPPPDAESMEWWDKMRDILSILSP